jgi:hypothetical protein
MKELGEYFEKLLWFIYRVLFTLLPGGLFCLIVVIFLSQYKLVNFDTVISWLETVKVPHWIIVFTVVFCVGLLFESFTHLIFRKEGLDFHQRVKENFMADEGLVLLKKYNPQIWDIIYKNPKSVSLGPSLFNFGLINGCHQSTWFNNYIWFLISREYLFSGLSLSLIAASVIVLPYSVSHMYVPYNTTQFYVLEGIQLGAIVLLFVYSNKLLKLIYSAHTKKYSKLSIILYLCSALLIVALALMACNLWLFDNDTLKPCVIFLTINTALFLTSSLLFLRAFREFLHVEYFIATFFAKDNYDKEMKK